MKDIFIVSDFDKTLTTAYIDGNKSSSTPAVFRNGGFIEESYVEKSFALFDTYQPLELDETIPYDERCKYMQEWWSKHLELFQSYTLTKEIIAQAANSGQLKLKEGVKELFEECHAQNIPILIFSAGIKDVIETFLKEEHCVYPNIHIIANEFTYKNDRVVGYSDKIIHSLNKAHHSMQSHEYQNMVKGKKHLFLLGDTLEDIGMKEHFTFDSITSFAFLNKNSISKKALFEKVFDYVIEGDSITPVMKILFAHS